MQSPSRIRQTTTRVQFVAKQQPSPPAQVVVLVALQTTLPVVVSPASASSGLYILVLFKFKAVSDLRSKVPNPAFLKKSENFLVLFRWEEDEGPGLKAGANLKGHYEGVSSRLRPR